MAPGPAEAEVVAVARRQRGARGSRAPAPGAEEEEVVGDIGPAVAAAAVVMVRVSAVGLARVAGRRSSRAWQLSWSHRSEVPCTGPS